ncbi:uncharacterized protein PG986_010692 [Apiospora aurea]|uniref:Uncharacterized protein n=1 Tax=Apiospora aurea TaxID=335848 RepID=A0ABR1Q2Z6_9PEZI
MPLYFDFFGPGSLELCLVSQDGRVMPIQDVENTLDIFEMQCQRARRIIKRLYEILGIEEGRAAICPATTKFSFVGAKALLKHLGCRNDLLQERLRTRNDYSEGRAYLLDDYDEFCCDLDVLSAVQRRAKAWKERQFLSPGRRRRSRPSREFPLLPALRLPITERSVDAVEEHRRLLRKMNKKAYRHLINSVNSCAYLNPADDKMLRDAVGELLGVMFLLRNMKDRLRAERLKYVDGRANLNREVDELNMALDLVLLVKGLSQDVFDRMGIDIRPDPPRPRNVPPPNLIIERGLLRPTAWLLVVALAIWLVMQHV